MRSDARWGLPLTIVLTFFATALVGPAGTAQAYTKISRYGHFSFSSLGFPTTSISGSRLLHPSRAAVFRLPPGARERPQHWYVLHLHLHVTIPPDSPQGTAYVVATSHRFASAEIRFDVRAGKTVRWTALGYIDGAQTGVAQNGLVDLRFRNVMPYHSVAPGRNVLSLVVQELGAHVARVVILGDSAIEYTPLGAAEIVIRATAPPKAAVGRPLPIDVVVSNRGDRPAAHVQVSTGFNGSRLQLRGQASRTISTLGPGQTRHLTIVYVPREPGHSRIFFLGSSTANRPGAQIDILVTGESQGSAGHSRGHRGLDIAIGAGMITLVSVLLFARRRSRRG